MNIITCVAPVNIAVIKYWGKSDQRYNIPKNDSISTTINMDNMRSKTTVMVSSEFKENRFWLNGKEENFNNKRLLNCLEEAKKGATRTDLVNFNIHIYSENNFPTAAGLASSASGYACLVFALSKLFEVKGDISILARLGSGSACRSIYGGWVRWHKGNDHVTSVARQIAPAKHWPELEIIILVVKESCKKDSSTDGMQRSVETSPLLEYRASIIVPERVKKMEEAILTKNFADFAKLTMQDSNQFHAICMETYPPLVYMNDVSHAIVEMVHAYNEYKGAIKLAYTFDAGPNACLYLLKNDKIEVMELINQIFPEVIDSKIQNNVMSKEINKGLGLKQFGPGGLKSIITTTVGEGPKILLNSAEHLLNQNGLPK